MNLSRCTVTWTSKAFDMLTEDRSTTCLFPNFILQLVFVYVLIFPPERPYLFIKLPQIIRHLQLLWPFILSFEWFIGVWIACADVSEHSVCSVFMGGVSRKNVMTLMLNPEGNTEKELTVKKCGQDSFWKLSQIKIVLKPFRNCCIFGN